MQQKKKTLSLVITHNCNLKCKYCYVREKSQKAMSFDVACQSIRAAFEDAVGKFDFVEINFIGGEPLCEFPMLRRLTDWVRTENYTVPHILYATTNGTLLDSEMKAWFMAHKHEFALGLSYDGQFGAQNANRSNSLSMVDLDFFLTTWPEQSLKMTIDEETVPCLAQNIIDLHRRGATVAVNCACGMPEWREESRSEYSKQLDLLVDFYLENVQYRPVNLIGDFNLIALTRPMPEKKRFCQAGTNAYRAVDVDGREYPCHLFSSLAIDSKEEIPCIDTLIARSKNECADCPLEAQCMTCYGMNFKLFGDVLCRESNLCAATMAQFSACCRWHAARLSRMPRGNYSPDDIAIAQALLKIKDWNF